MLDGYDICLGDRVYVTNVGPGVVEQIDVTGAFQVMTGRGRMAFSPGGFIGSYRRVYWDQPVIVAPPKNGALWQAYKTTAIALLAALRLTFPEGADNGRA